MNKNKLETYVNILLMDVIDPMKYRQEVDAYIEMKHAIDTIPDEYKTAAKEEAFRRILNKIKQNPQFFDIVEDNAPELFEWIPEKILKKLINLGHELNLDELHGQMKSHGEEERKRGRAKHKNFPEKMYAESSSDLSRLRHLSGLE